MSTIKINGYIESIRKNPLESTITMRILFGNLIEKQYVEMDLPVEYLQYFLVGSKIVLSLDKDELR